MARHLSRTSTGDESEECVSAFLLCVVRLANLLRVGGSVTRSSIDSHRCDGLDTRLRLDVVAVGGVVRRVRIARMHVGEWVALG
jgi:hypothetical protein